MLDIFVGRPDVEANGHEHLVRMKQAVPLGRVGTPMGVGRAELLLASDGASHVTGAAPPVDGGYGARSPRPPRRRALARRQGAAAGSAALP
jgi:NAD(P)-dependent dehydrogenase (short-subunit alcohol dehydrogenase family)